MIALVIGGDGFIGSALVAALNKAGHGVIATSRRGKGFAFDLAAPSRLPVADVAYITACNIKEPNTAKGWRVNVDNTIATAKQLLAAGVFVVFLSSAAVYTRNDTYALQKAYVEMFLQGTAAAIVRLGDVDASRLAAVTDLLVRVGEQRIAGVTA